MASLGLLMSCCLLPYLVSSIYSIVTALLQMPSTPDWLWGAWLSTVVEGNETLYMVLAEGPVCCVGAIGLLTMILGLVMIIGGGGADKEPDPASEAEYYAESEYDELGYADEYGEAEQYGEYDEYGEQGEYGEYDEYGGYDEYEDSGEYSEWYEDSGPQA